MLVNIKDRRHGCTTGRRTDMLVNIKGETRDYQHDVVVPRANPDHDWFMLGAMGLCGEAGEYSEYIKKMKFHDVPCTREQRLKELGDALWYLTLAAEQDGATLQEIAQLNTDKLVARYPDGFVPGGGIREGAGAR